MIITVIAASELINHSGELNPKMQTPWWGFNPSFISDFEALTTSS